jgi:hypothetical protein
MFMHEGYEIRARLAEHYFNDGRRGVTNCLRRLAPPA